MVQATSADTPHDDHVTSNVAHRERERERGRDKKPTAATGASAASIRAISAQFVTFYFRAPVKAFFKTRIDYMGFARAINPRVQANEPWSWRLSTPGLLAHAVKEHGWGFIPNQVMPPLMANVTIGAVLYTSYLTTLSHLHPPSAQNQKRPYPPPPIQTAALAGLTAGAIQSLVAAPLDALQVRFRSADMLEGTYTNMWQYARRKLAEIGARGVFAGYSLSLCKDMFGNAAFFAAFEGIKSQAYYEFLTRYYGYYRPWVLREAARMNLVDGGDPSTATAGDGHELRPNRIDTSGEKPTIRPHYALEPTFLLLAGAGASVCQQIIQHPLTTIQDVHYQNLEFIDYGAKLADGTAATQPQRTRTLTLYYKAWGNTIEKCKALARRSGGWRKWLYHDFIYTAVRQVPSTSAGLIVFELVRRKWAWDDETIRIEKDGFDILLT